MEWVRESHVHFPVGGEWRMDEWVKVEEETFVNCMVMKMLGFKRQDLLGVVF